MPLPTSRLFGILPGGGTIEAWTLIGSSGLTLEAITYGGIVTKLLLPAVWGPPIDVVLGFSELAPYLAGRSCFGALVGRVAGRITGAQFSLDGQTFRLAANDPPNHLHGGVEGFNKKVWKAFPMLHADGSPSLRLTYRSADGEEGYPGLVDVCVTYTVTHENAFLIEIEATSDKATPFSLTQHSYFNLAGEGSGDIGDHELEVSSDNYVPIDERHTLLDKLHSIDMHSDLRAARCLAEVIPLFANEHGPLYRIPGSDATNPLTRIAQLKHSATGHVLTCFTSCPYLQTYVGSHLDGSQVGKSGRSYNKYAGICFECEGYANAVNAAWMGNIILRPGEINRSATSYVFSRMHSGA